MRRIATPCFAVLFSVMLAAGCCAVRSTPEQIAPVRKKVGFFTDNGCRGGGVFFWARLLAYSPQLELVLVDGVDLRAGKLQGLDLLVCPGGGSGRQLETMQSAGRDALRKFIADGGAYLGICAGCYNVLNDKSRLQLLPYNYKRRAAGKTARLTVEVNKRGAELMGIAPERWQVRYAGGPIMEKTAPLAAGKGETLAVFRSSISGIDRKPVDFIGTPAIIYGTYGKGKVVASSVHPESFESSYPIALGCLYAASGIKATPVFPKKNYRPVRVGFYTGSLNGKQSVINMLELDRHPELDVELIDGDSVDQGVLHHLDVLIIPDAIADRNKSVFAGKRRTAQITRFLDDGGKVLYSGNGNASLPTHKNIINVPMGGSFVPYALKK